MCLQGNNSSFAFYHNFSDSCHQMSFLIQYCQSVCFTCLLLIMIIKYKVILFLTFFYPTKQLFSVFKQFSLAWKKYKFLVYFQSILKDKFQIHLQKKFLMTIKVVSILSSKYLSKYFQPSEIVVDKHRNLCYCFQQNQLRKKTHSFLSFRNYD